MTRENIRVNIPNIISLGRLLSVPVTVWLILNDDVPAAFWIFVVACISDAVDGYIAKRYNAETVLGGYLDPIADKVLLVSVFVTLGSAGYFETWLVILVVFRDGLIVCGAYLYHLLYQRLTMQPLMSSKINTTFQFALVAAVMGVRVFEIEATMLLTGLVYLVAATTLISGANYVVVWSRHAAAMESGR